MRKAARATAERFGVLKFSHSTVSRTLDALTLKIDELTAICPPTTELPQVGAEVDYATSFPSQPSLVMRSRWNNSRKRAAPHLFNVLAPLFLSPESANILAYRYINRYGRLLL